MLEWQQQNWGLAAEHHPATHQPTTSSSTPKPSPPPESHSRMVKCPCGPPACALLDLLLLSTNPDKHFGSSKVYILQIHPQNAVRTSSPSSPAPAPLVPWHTHTHVCLPHNTPPQPPSQTFSHSADHPAPPTTVQPAPATPSQILLVTAGQEPTVHSPLLFMTTLPPHHSPSAAANPSQIFLIAAGQEPVIRVSAPPPQVPSSQLKHPLPTPYKSSSSLLDRNPSSESSPSSISSSSSPSVSLAAFSRFRGSRLSGCAYLCT